MCFCLLFRTGDELQVASVGRCPVVSANELGTDDEDDGEGDAEEEPVDSEEDEEEEPERDECQRPCPRIFRQVCASNGETFNNHCLFLVANCR